MAQSPEETYVRVNIKTLDDIAECFSSIDWLQANITVSESYKQQIKTHAAKGHQIIEKAAGQHAAMIYAEEEPA